MSVTQDSNGWTVPTGNGTTDKIVYVDDDRPNDSGNGLTTGTAKKTIAAGISLLTAGSGDQLLLKRGTTYSAQTLDGLPSGRSTSQPLVVGTYGTGALPRILTGTSPAFDGTANNVVIQGIYFNPHTRSISDFIVGLGLVCTGSNRLIFEDCIVDGYTQGLVAFGGNGTQIRRNRFVNATGEVGHFQTGMYADAVTDILIEENVFDENGVLDNPTVFNHNCYLDAGMLGTSTVRYNAFSRSSSSALKMLQQTGTLAPYKNLFSRCGDQMEIGAYGGDGEYPSGTNTTLAVEQNVIVEPTKEFTNSPGWGCRIRHSNAGFIRNNVMANRRSNGSSTEAVVCWYWESVPWGPGITNIEFYGNRRFNMRGADAWGAGANGSLTSHDNIIDEPNLTTSFEDPYIVSLAATNVVTFTNDRFYRGGNTVGVFDAPSGVDTYAEFDSAAYTTGISFGAYSWPDNTRTLNTWGTLIEGTSDYDDLMLDVFRSESTVQDTTRIDNIRSALAWTAAGYGLDLGYEGEDSLSDSMSDSYSDSLSESLSDSYSDSLSESLSDSLSEGRPSLLVAMIDNRFLCHELN